MLYAETIDQLPAIAESAPQPWWEIILIFLGAVAAVATFFGLVWKIAKPHLEGYIESVVKPLQAKTDATHQQITTNGHTSNPPTLLDKVDRIAKTQAGTIRKVDDLQRSFDKHTSESEDFLANAVQQFAEQGITLHVNKDDEQGRD